MSCYCDYDRPAFSTIKFVTARKPHKCYECSRTIPTGSEYEYTAGSWDGDFQTFKTCEQCAGLRDSLSAGGCWQYGELGEEYMQYLYHNLPSKELAKAQFDKVMK